MLINLIKSVTRREWLYLSIIIALLIIITGLPYLYGYLTTPPDMVYTGLHHLTPGDTNVFLSMIEQTKQGDNVFINPYTAEPQHRLFINPLWLSIGWMAKIFNLPNLLALHIGRSIWAVLFVLVMFFFLKLVVTDNKKRLWFLVIILFASGLGVFFNPFLFNLSNLFEHPTDIWIAESVTFLTLYHSPHLIASLTLIVLIFFLMLLAFETNQYRYSLFAGLGSIFLLSFHPFNGPTVYGVLFLYILILCLKEKKINWQLIKHYAILCLLPLPVLVYYFLISSADWVVRNWSAQNILPSPSVWMYLIGYGLLILLAMPGLWITFKFQNKRNLLVISWFFCSALLIYFPISFQRRLSEGLHIPIAILAGFGIYYLAQKIIEKYSTESYRLVAFIITLAIILPLTNIQIVGQDAYMYATKKDLPYYMLQKEWDALEWIKENVGNNEIIFSSYYFGNFIPAYTNRIVWIGHGPQTINLPAKLILSEWFWRGKASPERSQAFLKGERVKYLVYSRKEREMGPYNPENQDYLEEVFSNNEVKIYRVE